MEQTSTMTISKMKEFYKNEWHFFRTRLLKPFILVFLLFVVITTVYWLIFPTTTAKALAELLSFFKSTKLLDAAPFILFIGIFLGNLGAAIFTVASGLVPYFFLSFLTILKNASLLGYLLIVSNWKKESIGLVMASLLPHGIVELPVIFYAISLGLMLCFQLTRRKRQEKMLLDIKEIEDVPPFDLSLTRVVKIFAFIIAPLLLIAAAIETFITPLFMGLFTH
jgi:stage II sporulation protein M